MSENGCHSSRRRIHRGTEHDHERRAPAGARTCTLQVRCRLPGTLVSRVRRMIARPVTGPESPRGPAAGWGGATSASRWRPGLSALLSLRRAGPSAHTSARCRSAALHTAARAHGRLPAAERLRPEPAPPPAARRGTRRWKSGTRTAWDVAGSGTGLRSGTIRSHSQRRAENAHSYFNPFPAKVIKIGPGARLSRDRLPCDSPIEATTPF
jgi:hypothetical protein